MMLSDIISWIQVQVIDIPRISVPQNKVSICQTILIRDIVLYTYCRGDFSHTQRTAAAHRHIHSVQM